jgi:hypothetical protein
LIVFHQTLVVAGRNEIEPALSLSGAGTMTVFS